AVGHDELVTARIALGHLVEEVVHALTHVAQGLTLRGARVGIDDAVAVDARPLSVQRAQQRPLRRTEVPLAQCRVPVPGEIQLLSDDGGRLLGAGEVARHDAADRQEAQGVRQRRGLRATLRRQDRPVRLTLYEARGVPGALAVAHEPDRVLIVTRFHSLSQCPTTLSPYW